MELAERQNNGSTTSAESSVAAEIERLHRELIVRASAGSWSDFGRLLSRRDDLLEKVSGREKRAVFERVLRCNSRILESAQADRDATGERLSALRKEHNVRDFYHNNSGA